MGTLTEANFLCGEDSSSSLKKEEEIGQPAIFSSDRQLSERDGKWKRGSYSITDTEQEQIFWTEKYQKGLKHGQDWRNSFL